MIKKQLFLLYILALPLVVLAEDKFSGPYTGVQLGYAYAKDKGKEYAVDGTSTDWTQKSFLNGETLGVAAGFNKVFQNHFLVGVESDFEAKNVDGKTFQKDELGDTTEYQIKTKINQAFSLRAKVGYLFDDSTLGYLTGGYALGKVKRKITYIDNDGDDGCDFIVVTVVDGFVIFENALINGVDDFVVLVVLVVLVEQQGTNVPLPIIVELPAGNIKEPTIAFITVDVP
jgi:opacity protein-like surface antigen